MDNDDDDEREVVVWLWWMVGRGERSGLTILRDLRAVGASVVVRGA